MASWNRKISAAPSNAPLARRCRFHQGIDYLKDKRTTCYVTVTLQVADGQVVIRSEIEAEYLPNNPSFGKRMAGVSRGTIEARIAAHLH